MADNDTGKSLRARLDYQPIHQRPQLKLPGGARVAVWTIVNIENWQPTGAMPRTVLPPPMGQPMGQAPQPQMPPQGMPPQY